MMNALHPMIAAVVVVAALVTLGLPATTKQVVDALKVGVAWTGIAMVMNAIFQWHDPSPLNVLLMNEKAGTFECVLLSIGYAFIIRGIAGALRRVIQGPGREPTQDS